MEYYFVESFSLNDIKKRTKLTISFDEISGTAKIYDRCDNYIKIDNLVNYDSEISVVTVPPLSGGEFVIHDIAYLLQILFFCDDTYEDMLEYMDEVGCDELTIENKAIRSFIELDLNNTFLKFASNGFSIWPMDTEICEEEREEAKRKRKSNIERKTEINPIVKKLLEQQKKRVVEIVSSKIKY